MAKILSVTLESIPEEIHLNDALSDLTVLTSIEFHKLDLQFGMEYCLYLYVYDIHGSIDIPVVIPNWDETLINRVTTDRVDDFLGKSSVIIKADKKIMEIRTPMTLRLGNQTRNSSSFSRKLDVFATMIPAIERASRWSAPFATKIVY